MVGGVTSLTALVPFFTTNTKRFLLHPQTTLPCQMATCKRLLRALMVLLRLRPKHQMLFVDWVNKHISCFLESGPIKSWGKEAPYRSPSRFHLVQRKPDTINDTITLGQQLKELVLCEFGQGNWIHKISLRVKVSMTLALNPGLSTQSFRVQTTLPSSKTSNDPLNLITTALVSGPLFVYRFHDLQGILALTSVESGTFTCPNIDFLTNEWDLVTTPRAL
ncbi:hypothetical protein K435DRAFT_794593 [Dendrothele bispora CBS 962.96]|uniref:Uncharacterized protein n=1 Tax=Dendrothele bispora (strain CBS 962.96) TaxID=1314807 RepID=A0A4S8MBN3_DENBC|nr:hypothetical protein K435DRAFT_794593 [Dendrothele bispora CBS 962.96]